MSVINILSPHVADLIAAGEVVERPASVVKELLENSFDAGAKHVTCEIRDGGATYIRVTDDGCGMAPEDAGIAFVRHATSKLSDESGLEHISTMGFRGEALAAISSVSHMELITRQKNAPEGTRVLLEAGDIEDMSPFGCPEGTTMICRNLFYNTPARLKFLKSDRSEASACITAAMRCALGRPDVSVRMIRDGKEEFFSPGDGKLDSCVYALLGREEAASMLACSSASESLSLSGFVSSPAEGRGNRSRQFLYLTLSFSSVDVNVHPAKTEIRFGSEKQVFDFVYQAVKLALASEDRLTPDGKKEISVPPFPAVKGTPLSAVQDTPSSAPADDSPTSRDAASEVDTVPPFPAPDISVRPPVEYAIPSDLPERAFSVPFNRPSEEPSSVFHAPEVAYQTRISLDDEKNVENSVQNVESSAVPNHKILGEAFRTYIIVECNGELILIDKHAAHERMIFDRLKAAGRSVTSQMLLIPAIVHLSLEEMELLSRYGELLTQLGFEIEPYGEKEVIVRGVPAEMSTADVAASVEEICEKLRSSNTPDPSGVFDEILHTVACKAAIKAGWDTQRSELEKIASAVLSGQVLYCPHGRPVSSVITRKDLDRLFKRIV